MRPCALYCLGLVEETDMRGTLIVAALLMALGGASDSALAQSAPSPQAAPGPQKASPSPSSGDNQQADRAQHTKSGQGGKQEPLPPTGPASGNAAAQPNPAPGPVLVDGRLNVPGAPTDSQTVPAKFSARNAALDAQPLAASPLPLSAEQRRAVMQAVRGANAPVATIGAKVTEELPASATLLDWPQGLADQMPVLREYKYVRLSDRILAVRAPNRIVVDEIKE
jgi:hypothetical protein